MDEPGEMIYENGEVVVKIRIVDDNDPSETTEAIITKACYDNLQKGTASLRKLMGDDGQLKLMVVDHGSEEGADSSDPLNPLNKGLNNNDTFNTYEQLASESLTASDNDNYSQLQSTAPNDIDPKEPNRETFIITEIPTGNDMYRVVITNQLGNSIYEKSGRLGESVELYLMGTLVSYEINGTNKDGSFRQTTVFIDSSDDKEDEIPTEGQELPTRTALEVEDSVNPEEAQDNVEEYVITEDTIKTDSIIQQIVTLTDKAGNILDKVTGLKNECVKLQVTDKAFEYQIQGPMDSGEPIVTSFMVNKNDTDGSNDDVLAQEQDLTESNMDPAENWPPPDLTKEEYAAIREQAHLVAAALENEGDLPSIQPYSEQLGSKVAYDDMISLVERYKSRAEEKRNDLTQLRKHSKLFIPMKASARKLTRAEWATNEAAAQVCRYIPALLFHKRKLFECAASIIENTRLFPDEPLRQSDVRDESDLDNRSYGGAGTVGSGATAGINVLEDSQGNVVPSNISRNFTGIINDPNNYMSGDVGTAAIFNQNFQSFSKRDMQLNTNEENAIRNAAEKLQEELYQYPIKPQSECKSIEAQVRDEIPKLRTMLEGNQSEVEQAHEYLRETSAVNGRLLPSQRTRAQPISPYDVAVNEASYHLAKDNIGLLTFRKVLADLAKKVVRATGCSFRHTTMGDKNFRDYGTSNLWLYNQENIPELDLSSAVKVLSDSLEDGPLDSLIGYTFVPTIKETLVNHLVDEEDEDEIYQPSDFLEKQILGKILFDCEAVSNVLDENAIFCHTGTDDLKKVRILNFSNFSFTSVRPMEINYCYNLVELNLYNNSLSYLPRCLFLPNLTKLNLKRNRFITVPLLEQFPKLSSVELDENIVRKLNNESLSYFCTELMYINNKRFEITISDGFNSIFLDAKTSIETMVQARWEEDLAMYFKKGVTKSEVQKVIETLVLAVRERKIYNEEKFFGFKDLIARKAAQTFLDSKIIDDDEEEEGKERGTEEVDEEGEIEEDNEKDFVSKISEKLERKKEFDNQSVEKGQILLQDEPIDRLTNVVGQALRNGKTVVYSVMRTAARQPGGDLIPVGGCDSNQNVNSNYLISNKKVPEILAEQLDTNKSDSETVKKAKTRPGPASFKKRMYGIEPHIEVDPCTEDELEIFKKEVDEIVYDVMMHVETHFTKRKSGRPRKNADTSSLFDMKPSNKENMEKKQNQFKLPKSLSDINSLNSSGISQGKLKQKEISSEEITKRIADIVNNSTGPLVPSEIRQLLGLSKRGRSSKQIKYGSDLTYQKHGVPIPDSSQSKKSMLNLNDMFEGSPVKQLPERPVSSNKMFNTRDSNRLKRFNSYGVEGEDSWIMEVFDEEGAWNVAETGESELDGKKRIRDKDIDYQPTPKHSKTDSSPTKSSDLNSESSFVNELRRKAKEKEKQSVSKGVVVTLPVSNIFKSPDITSIQGLSAITASNNGNIADYDPLHFIRCHARDNDPRDCNTKVWRCAFEPHPKNPYSETTSVVATCGGECVCLIDCRTGKVMKRFKSREEEFYTVAWTTVEMAAGHHINILAAAGKSRDIRLLHPEQLVCYSEMKGHQQEIACMVFHPRYPTVLFSGDAMATIIVWDIGIPSAPEYTSHYQMLAKLVCPRAHLNPVLNLVVMSSYDALVAGCEDGVFVWTFPEFRKYKPDEIREPDFEVKVPTHQEPCFDGLARLSDNIILVKCVEEGEIFSINFNQIMQQYKARKFDDQSRVSSEIMVRMRWQITDEIYINVSSQSNLGAVICGDNEGTIWLYDMSKQLNEEASGVSAKKANIKPIKLLDWPECSVESNAAVAASASTSNEKQREDPNTKNPIINCVEMSSDGKYLVAVTDNNLVCIWSVPTV